jgi:hypothetical protein
MGNLLFVFSGRRSKGPANADGLQSPPGHDKRATSIGTNTRGPGRPDARCPSDCGSAGPAIANASPAIADAPGLSDRIGGRLPLTDNLPDNLRRRLPAIASLLASVQLSASVMRSGLPSMPAPRPLSTLPVCLGLTKVRGGNILQNDKDGVASLSRWTSRGRGQMSPCTNAQCWALVPGDMHA